MSDLKPLVIKSGGAPPASKQYTWEILQQMLNFIDQIESKAVSEEDGDISKLGTVISGMPSVYARANMFPIALKKIGTYFGKLKNTISSFQREVNSVTENIDIEKEISKEELKKENKNKDNE